jgi:predicted DNA-binding ribbon-helix-helix protein
MAEKRLAKRSFAIAGHRTSIALESEFWNALETAAREERIHLVALVARVDSNRGERNLASALRVYALLRALGKGLPSL